MSYELIITRKAKIEINEAYIYYETAKPGLGEKFIGLLEIYFNRIINSPNNSPKRSILIGKLISKNFHT